MRKNGPFSGLRAVELLDGLVTAVIVLDRELRVSDANHAAEGLLSTSVEKLWGQPLQRLVPGDPRFVEAVRAARVEGRTFTERDMRLAAPHDAALKVDCEVTPWWVDPDQPPFMIMEMVDADRHHRIPVEGHVLVQNQVTLALMRGLAHEIKNPIGGIRGAAQLLERELEDKGQAEYTRVIIGEADRLHALVDRMLGPRGRTQKQPLNIHDVLERVRRIVEAETERGVVFVRDYDPSIPETEADPDQLVQAFLNIARNAIQAVSENGGTITLRTRVQRKFTIASELHRLVIRVEIIDTGPGVGGDIADSIFFPMVSGRAEGTGLGLSIAQTLVNRQGGLIGFRSEPGDTVFSVWLPIRTET